MILQILSIYPLHNRETRLGFGNTCYKMGFCPLPQSWGQLIITSTLIEVCIDVLKRGYQKLKALISKVKLFKLRQEIECQRKRKGEYYIYKNIYSYLLLLIHFQNSLILILINFCYNIHWGEFVIKWAKSHIWWEFNLLVLFW